MFGNLFDPATIASDLANQAMMGSGALANGGLGAGLQNAMGQIWQVNQANQNATMYNNQLQQQMDMLNSQLGAAQNMQGRQLAQGQQNQALAGLTQLANTHQLGGVLSNMFSGLGGAMGGLFGGMMGGGGGSPLNMHSSSGAGISFGSPAGGGGGGGGGAAPNGYTGNPIAAGYDPSSASQPMLGGRNITNPNAYGGGFHSPAPLGSMASSARAAYPINQGGFPTDPTSVLMRALQGGNFGL